MTLTELKYIVAVARERHFGRAAEACFVAQPTLSVAVKKLEEELDVKLFERSASEVTLTPLGEEVVRQAQVVLEQSNLIRDIAKRGKDPLAGPLRLGIIYTIGGVIYALKLPLFNEKHEFFGSHEIFHLFVMAGSFCHFIFMYCYVA